MNTGLKITIGLTVASIAGVAVFMATRSAAAASAGTKAFRVTDCATIELVDTDAAETAVRNAALSNFTGMDQLAVDFLDKCIADIFADFKCPDIASASVVVPPAAMIPEVLRGKTLPIALFRLCLIGKTVGDLKTEIESGKFSCMGITGASSADSGDAKSGIEYFVPLIYSAIATRRK